MIRAFISQAKGIAIFDDNDRIGIIDIRKIDEIQFCDDNSPSRSLLAAPDLEPIEVMDIAALRTHLLIRKHREELLHAVLILLDGDRSKELRKIAAESLLQSSRYDDWTWIESVLLSTPLPDGADAIGASHLSTNKKSFFLELLSIQEHVKTLQIVWNALPVQCFSGEKREQVYIEAIQNGVFRSLIKGEARSTRTPFNLALKRYAWRLDQNIAKALNSSEISNALSQVNSQKIQTADQIWDVHPWRCSWMASTWPKIEFNSAFHIATNLLNEHENSKMREATWRSIDECEGISNSWKVIRNHPVVSESITLLLLLQKSDVRQLKKKIVMLEMKQSTQIASRNKKSKSLPAYLGIGNFVDSERKSLKYLILDFFGATFLRSKSALELNREKEIIQFEIAQAAYRNFDKHLPIHQTYTKALLSKINGSYQPDSNFDIDKNKLKYIHALEKIIGLFVLDQVFQRGGVLAYVLPEDKINAGGKRVSLMNLTTCESRSFDGFAATMLEKLQIRLTADLISGLPIEKCGWMRMDDFASNIELDFQSVRDTYDSINQKILQAGFSQHTCQKRDGGVRLNPDYVQPAGKN